MINSIDEYLNSLKKELKGCDSATIQDALSDAEEHLRTAIDKGLEESDKVVEADILSEVIEKYGAPDEIANAYRDIEDRIRPAFARDQVSSNKSWILRFFGIFTDAGAWSSLIYMIFALVTGIIYFTWAVTGISIGVSMIILIIGVPIIILFLYSVRGIAFIEGRIVEALLGERMPRRSRFTDKNVKLWDRIKNLFTDRRTWTGILYLILQLPIGIIYFTIMTVLIALSIASIFAPIAEIIWQIPIVQTGNIEYVIPVVLLPLITVLGFLLLTITMHLAKFVGKIHGKYAKILLVSE
ncbi:sensor domain-containing protein [bacterium]|nr:sensor domain-containing protein [bacterium]